MSHWTSILAVMHVDIKKELTEEEALEYLKIVIDCAPKITGSEGNADVFINKGYGGGWSSCDCERCFFRGSIKKQKIGFSCKAPADYKCKSIDIQRGWLITVHGQLRDRHYEQTNKEWQEFMQYLTTSQLDINFDIDDLIVRIC